MHAQRKENCCQRNCRMSRCLPCCTSNRRFAAWNKGQNSSSDELLVLGLEGAGKSLLMRQLCNLANGIQKPIQQIQPTVGVELYKVNVGTRHRGRVNCAREIGGCMVPVWPQYFASACCLLYVINLEATGQLAAAAVELHGTVEHPDMQGKHICIAFAQQAGQEPSMSPGILDHVVGIDSLHDVLHGLLTVVHVSLKNSAGLYDLLQWVKTSTHSQC